MKTGIGRQAITDFRRRSGILVLVGVTGLASCGTVHPSPKEQILRTLRGCLDHLSMGERSPCVNMDTSKLSGISRQQLIAALGPPTFCHPMQRTRQPMDGDCLPSQRPVWSFYVHRQRTVGGGVEFVCKSDENLNCAQLVWIAGE
jgi:hypothetical protein